jgi:NTP pyrophosphatase (non-canonical NTP hydrolase)
MIEQLGKTSKLDKEILNITLEECSEVVQCISKIFRFGWDSVNPKEPTYTNRMHLTEEVGDLLCMLNLMILNGMLDKTEIDAAISKKVSKLKLFSDIEL